MLTWQGAGPTAGVRRFITRAQVAAMGMSHLVGTPLLRAYMHGYFVHQRLWQKVVGLAPGTSAAAAQRSAALAQQLEAQRASRITLLKRLPKVGGPAVWGGMWWARGLVMCCWRALAAAQGLRGLWWGALRWVALIRVSRAAGWVAALAEGCL